MEKQVFEFGTTPNVHFRVEGSLQLKGRDEDQLDLRASSKEDLDVERDGDTVRVICRSNLEARVPMSANISIELVTGNAELKAIDGELEIGEIHGSLTVKSIAQTKISLVAGNLTGKHIEGSLTVDSVHGSATLRDIDGALLVNEIVAGNLNIADIGGSVRASTHGSLTARLDPQPGETYELVAAGNLLVRLPDDASARVDIRQVGGSLHIDVDGPEVNSLRQAPAEFVLGDGEATLILSTDGSLTLAGHAPDWEMSEDFDANVGEEFTGMAEEISESVMRQMEAQMEMLERQLESQMKNLSSTLGATAMSQEQMERVSQRAREASQRATERAQERMQQAQERIRRKMEQVQRKAEQRQARHQRHAEARERRSWGFEWPSAKAEPAADPVSDEERMLILKMLEEKKISPEEADQLLSALE